MWRTPLWCATRLNATCCSSVRSVELVTRNARSTPAHRLDILEVTLHDVHMREPMRVHFLRIACDCAHVDTLDRQSLDDFAPHRLGRPGNQNHGGVSSRRPTCASAEMAV